jgi:hypothetical protein
MAAVVVIGRGRRDRDRMVDGFHIITNYISPAAKKSGYTDSDCPFGIFKLFFFLDYKQMLSIIMLN